MSILILGKTICPICNKSINEDDKYYSFPAFVINIKDSLYIFSDATFHESCLEKHKLGRLAKKYASLFIEKIKPANRRCLISGNMITAPQNHIFIEYLTSKDDDFLHQFNFTHIDKRNLPDWVKRKRFIKEINELKNSGTWEEIKGNNYLGKLIVQLSDGL